MKTTLQHMRQRQQKDLFTNLRRQVSVYALYASFERLLSIKASFIYAFALCTIETYTTKLVR